MTDQGQPLTECPTCKLKRPRDAIQCDCGYVFGAHTGIGREQKELAPRKKNLEGLEGWLAVVGLGVISMPFRFGAAIVEMYLGIFSDGTWAAITTSGTQYYNPQLAAIIGGELVVNVAAAFVSVYLIYLYFSKKMSFPKWWIGMLIFNPAFVVVDTLLLSFVIPDDPELGDRIMSAFGCGTGVTVIWIYYMLESARVKATFVR